jgi:hypothetical protein
VKADPPNTQSNPSYALPRKIADLDPAIKESSGIVASRSNPGMYWTHNDSGDGPFLYAFDESGRRRGIWRVSGAKARDWEALAAGPGPERTKTYLYIGDIGNNSGRRTELIVYRLPEPAITDVELNSSKSKPAVTETAEVFRLRYPGESHDAEALLVHPRTGDLFIVTKEVWGSPHVYFVPAPLAAGEGATLRSIGEVSIPSVFGGTITDGAISPDGSRLVLCDYLRAYESVLAKPGAEFNSIWKQPFTSITLGSRKQGEAITYRLDGKALIATSEGSPAPLIEIARK